MSKKRDMGKSKKKEKKLQTCVLGFNLEKNPLETGVSNGPR